MALVDLWRKSPEQISGKNVQQIVAFAGDGKLTDGNLASQEFRTFLAQVPSSWLIRYASECLGNSFVNSGLVLQDSVNEIGNRIGFRVSHGRYRGVTGQLGYDGLWESADGHALVVEVKTTDAYRIDLNTIANYRRGLIKSEKLSEEHSSILIVVGRQDTGDLEAQIRGSRHAWDVRLISTDALVRHLTVKEELEDPRIQEQIHAVLRPREFTRLDDIVDLLFSTTEDIKQDQVSVADSAALSDTDEDEGKDRKPKFTPVAFHDACIRRLEKVLGTHLIKRSRTAFASSDRPIRVICAVSREHARSGSRSYWFAFHPHQEEFLRGAKETYAAFGCGSESQLLIIPFTEFSKWLVGMNETSNEGRSYRHVSISRTQNRFELVRRHGFPRIDVTQYLIDTP
jgi:hypothetical protein